MKRRPAHPAHFTHLRLLSTRLMALILGLAAAAGAGAAGDGVPHRQVADMLYEVAFANRKVYTRDIVQRLTIEDSVITASEYFHEKQALPLPAQMFRLAAEELLDHTDAYWLALRALTPINPASGPLTPVEEQGLQHVMANPEERFYAEEEIAGRRSLVAVYADVANVEACVACHNGHARSPRNDFKLGDVMGGVVIRLFMDQSL